MPDQQPTARGLEPSERRREMRFPFYRELHYYLDGRKHRGLLQNLSLGGVRLLCRDVPHRGGRVAVSLPRDLRAERTGTWVEGQIVWMKGHAAGLQFLDVSGRIARGLFDVLLHYQDRASAAEIQLFHKFARPGAVATEPANPSVDAAQLSRPNVI